MNRFDCTSSKSKSILKIRSCPLFAGGDNSKLLILLCIFSTLLSVKLLIGVSGCVESESGIVFTVRSSNPQWNGHAWIVPCHEAAWISYCEFHIENESKVDEINIEERNQTELNLVGYESKVNRIEKFEIRPNLNLNPHHSRLGIDSLRHQHLHKTVWELELLSTWALCGILKINFDAKFDLRAWHLELFQPHVSLER